MFIGWLKCIQEVSIKKQGQRKNEIKFKTIYGKQQTDKCKKRKK